MPRGGICVRKGVIKGKSSDLYNGEHKWHILYLAWPKGMTYNKGISREGEI